MKGENTMYDNLNPLDELVNKIKGNTNFLNRLFSPRVSIPLIAISLMVLGVIIISR
jgi:hypothetical protein